MYRFQFFKNIYTVCKIQYYCFNVWLIALTNKLKTDNISHQIGLLFIRWQLSPCFGNFLHSLRPICNKQTKININVFQFLAFLFLHINVQEFLFRADFSSKFFQHIFLSWTRRGCEILSTSLWMSYIYRRDKNLASFCFILWYTTWAGYCQEISYCGIQQYF